MSVNYKPYAERTPDFQYRNTLRRTLPPNEIRGGKGRFVQNPFQDTGRYSNFSLAPLTFDLNNGFPLITERRIGFWRKFISEIWGFMNGARTLDELRQYGNEKTWAGWWEDWVYPEKCALFGLETGDLGDGSYTVLGKYPTPDGVYFNQFLAMIEQMRDFPGVTTHMVTSWMPVYALGTKENPRKVVVAPCHGNLVRVIILNGKLILQHVQRSADMPVGAVGNIAQYPAIAIALARTLRVEASEYIHFFMDGHTYASQVDHAKRIICRQPKPFPTLRIADNAPEDFFALRPEHFELTDYHPHPAMNDIPVTE